MTTVLVTAAGAPGTAALVRALRENGERAVRVVGTDMAERSVGRHLCDAFQLVPAGSDPEFADAMLEVVRRESVEAILPQSSFDLLGLAEAKERFGDVAVMVSSPDAVRRSNDKAESYALLDEIGVPGPKWRRVVGGEAVAEAARELGYPDEDVALKPAFSSGSRGFRILSAEADRREQLLKNRPGVAEALRLEELVELLGDDETPLLVMELATGLERTIDGIADGGRIALGHPKTRESMRAGLAMYFATLDDDWLMEIAAKIVESLSLDHFFNIQLVGDKVIEINPRISTIVYQEDLNLPWLGVKHALGEISAEDFIGDPRAVRSVLRQVEWVRPRALAGGALRVLPRRPKWSGTESRPHAAERGGDPVDERAGPPAQGRRREARRRRAAEASPPRPTGRSIAPPASGAGRRSSGPRFWASSRRPTSSTSTSAGRSCRGSCNGRC